MTEIKARRLPFLARFRRAYRRYRRLPLAFGRLKALRRAIYAAVA